MNQQEKVKAISKALKARFTNLTVEETIDLAYKIIEVIEDQDEILGRSLLSWLKSTETEFVAMTKDNVTRITKTVQLK